MPPRSHHGRLNTIDQHPPDMSVYRQRVLRSVNTLWNLHQPPLFQRRRLLVSSVVSGGVSDGLVGTSLSGAPETGDAQGTVRSTSDSCLAENRAGSVLEAGAPRLLSPESSRPAVPLSHPPHTLPPPSLPPSVRQVDASV
ncbi:unnamed protein product [Pleuronectes platessa]|uniref:Uncharacterized protein n=1 Tax=Pleuronectes platessa TaxID=8262 RepID=A0A9N7VF85_PLEPL|nr:unnamed protein product [Pleuronectes platessa]